MLKIDSKRKQKLLLKGKFGLEMETLRVNKDGYFSKKPHPFEKHPHIVKDFCENQTEINTGVEDSAKKAIEALHEQYETIQRKVKSEEYDELLWPFSNPPYIRNEQDIPIASYVGKEREKTDYRYYLSDRYGRYKMTFSGIHVNYSFEEELLQMCFQESAYLEYQEYKNQVYVELAEKLAIYGWLLVAITAASPVLDCSYFEKGKFDENVFLGLASIRCSELGYWNYFSPIFNYENIRSYTKSISEYVENKLIAAPSELYYPIRLKPKGVNTLENLAENGVGHIELRMYDLNPLAKHGIEEKDIVFAQLLMGWLLSKPRIRISPEQQVQAVQNFKNAAHYDLKTVNILLPNGEVKAVADTAHDIIVEMKEYYKDFPQKVIDVLSFQENKFIDAENRYSWILRKNLTDGFVQSGIQVAKNRQAEICGLRCAEIDGRRGQV